MVYYDDSGRRIRRPVRRSTPAPGAALAAHAGHRITYEDVGRPVSATDPHHDTVTCRTCGVRIPEEEN